MQSASIIASRSSPTASARSRVPPRNRLLIGHMGSPSLQHLPSSTHSRRTSSAFFLGSAGGATGASGADAATGGAPQPPLLGGGAPQPPVASSGRERGGSRSRLLGRERDLRRRREREDERERRRFRGLSSRELDMPPYGLRSMSSLDVSHASHTLRQLSRRMRCCCAAITKTPQLALKAQFCAGSAKVPSTAP